MKIIGLTGGIGSGKTTVAKMFKDLGVPVYIADVEARKLTNNSKVIKRKLVKLFGDSCYQDGMLDRKYVAGKVFNDSNLLDKLNSIIHPKVAAHFKRWQLKQQGPICIKEAAILFENDGYKQCDLTILVVSPEQERIRRVVARDEISEKEVLSRIKNQWSDDKKRKYADIIIENIDLISTKNQVLDIHSSLA
jgi:dephospho-CoA kinase